MEINQDLDMPTYYGKKNRYENMKREALLKRLSKNYLLKNSEVCYMLTTDELFNVLKDYLYSLMKFVTY